jgi:hypothetical protein
MNRARRPFLLVAHACGALLSACGPGSDGVSLHDLPAGSFVRPDSGASVPTASPATSAPPAGQPDASADAAVVADSAADTDAGADPNPPLAPDADSRDAGPDATEGPPDVRVTPGTDAGMAQPSCNPRAVWSDPVAVGVAFVSQALVTMTSDELTVAWVLATTDGKGDVFSADRVSTSDPFGSPTSLRDAQNGSPEGGAPDAGSGYFAFDRVALSADGLTLVGVAVGGLALAEFSRVARDQPFFGYPQPARWASLGRALLPGETLGDPVLAPDGDDVVYSRYGQSHTVSVYEAFRAGPVPWGAGAPRQSPPLQMTGGLRKRPLSLSADRLTLFVWDEATNAAYGLFRSDPMSDFNGAQPYGLRFSLQANASCTRLYFVAPAATGFALYATAAM